MSYNFIILLSILNVNKIQHIYLCDYVVFAVIFMWFLFAFSKNMVFRVDNIFPLWHTENTVIQ